eukprot:3344497-Amphidinium_carterae.1
MEARCAMTSTCADAVGTIKHLAFAAKTSARLDKLLLMFCVSWSASTQLLGTAAPPGTLPQHLCVLTTILFWTNTCHLQNLAITGLLASTLP